MNIEFDGNQIFLEVALNKGDRRNRRTLGGLILLFRSKIRNVFFVGNQCEIRINYWRQFLDGFHQEAILAHLQ